MELRQARCEAWSQVLVLTPVVTLWSLWRDNNDPVWKTAWLAQPGPVPRQNSCAHSCNIVTLASKNDLRDQTEFSVGTVARALEILRDRLHASDDLFGIVLRSK
jgi:hypothetical protein